jgi:hypothetical protein
MFARDIKMGDGGSIVAPEISRFSLDQLSIILLNNYPKK